MSGEPYPVLVPDLPGDTMSAHADEQLPRSTAETFRLNYTGYHGRAAWCDVHVERAGEDVLVIVSEASDNPGTSVTNCAEVIATAIAARLRDVPVWHLRFVERYPASSHCEATICEVTFEWSGRTAARPAWRHLGADGLDQLRGYIGVSGDVPHRKS